MVRGSLSAGEADQRTYPTPSTIPADWHRRRVDSLRAIGNSHMAQTIPFGSLSTADQVLAGVDLRRRRIVVTECNSGIGFATMQVLSVSPSWCVAAQDGS